MNGSMRGFGGIDSWTDKSFGFGGDTGPSEQSYALQLYESSTEVDSGTPGPDSIGALLNAAKHITTATACKALDQHRKRRRSTTEETSSVGVHFSVSQVQADNQVEAIETNIAEVAEVGRLGDTLGGYLFKGIDTTHMRNREQDRGIISFTETVRLHFGYREGEDFKLEVWLCSSVGKAIVQARISVEDLRGKLSDYLFGSVS
ncbi:uncharacterized protein RSE6_14801 [Rhynchosporium secalis]|uniref:Uncharacterized protein n=1 Tax=Rhynchosporium secalis TaxID=38038 RepID=A0A1E1MWR7_RHYSE|nr:uncharacterized protein RSE6_14801 [Rhynchosporium secalis]